MDLRSALENARTIAIVGSSPDPAKPSHRVTRYLIEAGYTVIPVNPGHDEILGLRSYPSLAHIPAEIELDIVDIFRRPQHTEGVVEEVVARMEATGQRPIVWTQIGVHAQPAERLAEAHGLTYVANRCLMAEHERLLGLPPRTQST